MSSVRRLPTIIAADSDGSDPIVGPPGVVVRNLELIYPNGVKALDDVSFEVKTGEQVAILGSSGSGKSTLLGCLSGRLSPTVGRVECAGRTAVIHQDLRLVRQRSALQNVLHGTLGRRRSVVHFPAAEKRRAMALLQRVSLDGRVDQPVGRLSGGEQQRVAIARALMQNPAVLLADEPVASLDEILAQETMQLMSDLARERGLTMISVLHDCRLAERFAERIFGMESGQLVYNAKPNIAAPSKPIEHCRACLKINAARPNAGPCVKVEMPKWHRSIGYTILAVVAVALYGGSIWGLGISSQQLRGSGSGIVQFLVQLVPTSWQQVAGLSWGQMLWKLLETLQMALIGTTLGVLIAWPLSALAAKNVGPQYFRRPMRFVLNVVRTVPSLLWALLFVAAVGLGAFSGILALTAYSLGYLTKFFYEAFEGVEPGPPDALGEMGANGPQRFMHAVWPAARPAVWSSSLFMLEYNVRAATVLGIVGAGGIGELIMYYFEYRDFPTIMVILIMLLIVVLVIDALSTWARARLVRA